jgi:hypothetical protein
LDQSNYKLSNRIYYNERYNMYAYAIECRLVFYHPNTIQYYTASFALEYLMGLFKDYKFVPFELRLK